MMKWKARTETTNIGILELGNLTFDEDYMVVSINKEHGYSLSTVWSDKPVIIDFTFCM